MFQLNFTLGFKYQYTPILTNDPYFSNVSLLVKTRTNWFSKDNSANNLSLTTNGDVKPSVKNPFSRGSIYFDGSSDYLTFTNQTFTGSFTCECWYYQTGNPTGYSILFGGSNVGVSASNTQFYVNNTGGIGWADNAASKISPTGTANKNQWNHIAFVRSGTTTYIFLNGSQVATLTNSASIQIDRIGDVGGAGAGYSPFGYISNIRISNIARYTSNFSVPTSDFVSDANTILLINQKSYTPTSFTDSSSNAYTITTNGNTVYSPYSPFTDLYEGSTYFDGSGDYISIPNNSNLQIGTADFTVEFWVYFNAVSAFRRLVTTTTGGFATTSIVCQTQSANKLYCFEGTVDVTSTTTITTGQWYYYAVTRTGGNLRLYINGILEATSSGATSNNTEYFTTIGGYYGGGEYHNGYLSNVRITKGLARYTGSTHTVPTTPLSADTNTQLLTCQSQYTTTNDLFFDHSANNLTITKNGNIAQGNFGPTSTVSSAYFDGTGDYLSGSSGLIASGSYTLEAYVYLTSYPSVAGGIIATTNAASSPTGFYLRVNSSGNVQFSETWGTNVITSSTTLSLNTWYHVTGVRNANTATIYIAGISRASGTFSKTYSSTTFVVGRNYTSDDSAYFPGYISLVRVSNIARYTSTFTPATSYDSDPNTVLFLKFNNAAIYDATGKNNIETIGNTANTYSQNKFNSPSIVYDGTSDYLTFPTNSNFDVGSGDFTIDGWFYLSALPSAYKRLFSVINATSATNNTLIVEISNSNYLVGGYEISGSYQTVTSSNILTTGWHSFTLKRSGSTLSIMLDSTVTTTSCSGTALYSSTNTIFVGRWYTSGGARDFAGHVYDLRVTKGVARANVVPTAPFPTS